MLAILSRVVVSFSNIQKSGGKDMTNSVNWREIWRCGKILDRIDYEQLDGIYTELWVEYENKYYFCTMKNGDILCFEEIDYPWEITK